VAAFHRIDVLVLGSGIAGLFYALQVAERASVAIVTKKRAADSATNWAQGGIAAVKSSEDSFAAHAQDTLTAGAGLCDPRVVEHVVERGPAMIDALLKLGADFDAPGGGGGRRSGEFDLGREGGHSHRRILHHRDATGREIERVLLERARAGRSSACCSSAPAPTRTSLCSRTTSAWICSRRARRDAGDPTGRWGRMS
jgi:L-aspartate oxidase